jgi:phage gp36-like protein
VAGSYYSDDADLLIRQQRLVELTDNQSNLNAVDQAVLDRASVKAQVKIDGRLRGKYPVPFAQGSVPADITAIHEDLKLYYLFKYSDALTIPSAVVDDYKQALADLEDLADADGGLILDSAQTAARDGTAAGAGGAINIDPNCPGDPQLVFGTGREPIG